MNQANIKTSQRLRRALAALKAAPEGLTTRQLIQRAKVCAVNSVASELRANGIRVDCLNEGRRNGSSIFRYKLAGL